MEKGSFLSSKSQRESPSREKKNSTLLHICYLKIIQKEKLFSRNCKKLCAKDSESLHFNIITLSLRGGFLFVTDKIKITLPRLALVFNFLTELSNAGNSSALVLSVIILDGAPIQNNSYISRFTKGIFNLKTLKPKYVYSWNINIVLKFLKNWKSHN